MMHTGLGRSHPLHVEYVHIGAALSVIQGILTEAILSHPRLPLARKIAVITALGKVIWIQNDLFAKWYVRDGEEFSACGVDGIGDGETPVVVEKEGWLHGRRMLAPEGDEENEEARSGASDDTACPTVVAVSEEQEKIRKSEGKTEALGCPFSGAMADMKL
jgi:hypothetical protein